MDNRIQDNRYEALYSNLADTAQAIHRGNKQRIRVAIILLLLSPFILCFIRWITDSDKIVFLLVWLFCVFAICCYLIGIEYLDNKVQKALSGMTGEEMEFDGLLPEAEQRKAEIREKLRERVEARGKDAPAPPVAVQKLVEEADLAVAAPEAEVSAEADPQEGGEA